MATPKTVVLITGANAGIGFDSSAAIVAASAKYHVIMGSRSLEKGKKALEDIQTRKETQGSLSLVQLDITDEESIAAAAKDVESSFSRLDVLVNNAGIISTAPSLIAQLRETFETNTFGSALVTEAFVPLLKKSSDPHLVYVNSDLGSIALKLDDSHMYHKVPATAYRMAKAALNMLMACHVVEFKEWGCKVWAFNPGFVVTNLMGEANREALKAQGAGSSEDSAQALLKIIAGERDDEIGNFVHKDGVHPW